MFVVLATAAGFTSKYGGATGFSSEMSEIGWLKKNCPTSRRVNAKIKFTQAQQQLINLATPILYFKLSIDDYGV